MNYKDFTLITADSRKVIPGALFVAVKGYASDGHNYIQSAIDKGATGIICEHLPEGTDVPESSLRDPSHTSCSSSTDCGPLPLTRPRVATGFPPQSLLFILLCNYQVV